MNQVVKFIQIFSYLFFYLGNHWQYVKIYSLCVKGTGGAVMEQWDDFLAPYKQAVEELKVKLKGLRVQFQSAQIHSPIEFVTGRVKADF